MAALVTLTHTALKKSLQSVYRLVTTFKFQEKKIIFVVLSSEFCNLLTSCMCLKDRLHCCTGRASKPFCPDDLSPACVRDRRLRRLIRDYAACLCLAVTTEGRQQAGSSSGALGPFIGGQRATLAVGRGSEAPLLSGGTRRRLGVSATGIEGASL